jgi:hypothetical protein
MKHAILAFIAALTSLIAGAVVRAIAPASPRVPWVLGAGASSASS